jgi:hypothetical protein
MEGEIKREEYPLTKHDGCAYERQYHKNNHDLDVTEERVRKYPYK